MLMLLLLQKFMKKSFLRLKQSIMINQLNFKNFSTSSKKMAKWLNLTELIFLRYLILKLWRKFLTDTTLHIFHAQTCKRGWKAMQHSSSELQSAVTLLKQIFSNNLPSKVRHRRFFVVKTLLSVTKIFHCNCYNSSPLKIYLSSLIKSFRIEWNYSFLIDYDPNHKRFLENTVLQIKQFL